jgi:DNA repair exonuclease SbcCD ATPase subunit
MKEYTSKYIRPPPTHPVPFIGFEFAKIPSREIVEHRLNQVLKKTREATTLTVTIIRAEWGEGKTDAFERYIKPEVEREGDVAYLVSTSTIINKLSKANALLPTSPPESVTLLSIIFHSIKDELRYKNEDYSRFPDENIHEDPYIYLTKVLQNHMTAKTKKRMYIFIDEFEEILIHSPELQKKFLSGLKELINGQLKMIHTDGEFQGCVHFFIACTPYAYNRLKEDVTLKEIFGSISSRIGANIIDLPQISKNEAIQFLVDILRYCYDYKLPSPLPIKSAGVLNGIATISQRNLRPMIQFMGELLSTASTNDKLEVIDYHIFIDAMRGREISVFGETTSCIDEDLLTKIERTLLNVKIYGKNCLELFRLLAGELKPFSLQEIETRLGLEGDQIHNLVEIINQELSKILIPKAISRLMPLKDGKDVSEVIDSLNPSENSILLSHNRIPLSKFYEEFVYYEVDENGRLKPILVIPKDDEEILKAFEVFEDVEIDEDDAKFLKRKLEKFLEPLAKDTKFMLSKELSLQLFPSPVISQIDFIEDRQKRMGLWREAIKNFADMNRALRDGFIEVINSSDEFKISGIPNVYTLKCYLQPGIETAINVAIYTSTIGININDVEQVKDILRKEKVDLLLLLYVGTMDEDASRELSNIPKVLVIQLKTIRAQQLIALSLARDRGLRINDKILKGKLELIYHEVGFSKLFSGWMEICKNRGILITDLIKTSGEKDKDLADAMVYYLEKIGYPLTFESVYKNLEQLRSFTMYGTKAPFCPFDIEKPEDLQIYQEDLIKNGFIKESEDGTLEILRTPIEQRILELVNRGINTIEEIKRNFIIIAQNENLIEQVYLPVLERKGQLIVEKDSIKLLDFKYLENETVKEYNAYCKKIEGMKKEYWDYSHICISKEKESKVIMIEDFDKFIKQLWLQYENVQIRYDEELRPRLSHLISALLKYFNNALYPTIYEALKRGREIVKEIDQYFSDTELLIKGILVNFNKYSDKNYTLEDVEEYKQLQGLKEKVQERLKKVYTREEIVKEVDLLENTIYGVKGKDEGYPKYFYFKKPPKDASYFNFKVYDAEQRLKLVKSKNEEISNECKQINNYIENSSEYYDEISAKLAKYDISDVYKLSKNIFNLLKSYQAVPIKAPQQAFLSLEDVKSFFSQLYKAYKEHSSKIGISLNIIQNLIKEEKTLNSAKNIIFAKVNNFKFFFEGYESETKIIEIASIVQENDKKYELMCQSSESLGENIKEIDEFNEAIQEKLNDLSKLISSLDKIDEKLRDLCQKRISYIEAYHSNITKMLDVLKEAGEDATGLKKAFKQTVDLAIEYLNNLSSGNNVKVKWRDIEEELASLENQLLDSVKRILSKEEFKVLLLIIEKTATRRWLTLPEIIEDIASVLNKGKEEVSETVERLANKKLLKKGISLPIEVS